MIRFLHIADIHLGTNQYNSPDNIRKKDFFLSFNDVINRYAITKKVDFVLIAGDLFDKSRIDPNTLNQAILVFKELKECNIPVFVIEGNHDSQWSRDSVSWLQFLGEHDYITFLKPAFIDNKIVFNKCDKENLTGGYFEFNDQIRIIGTQWFGSNTARIIPEIADAIKSMGDYPYTILMMHAGVEGYLAGYGTITKASLEPLRSCVNYIALGHIHKYYSFDNWAINPGSLEACCFPEFFDPHGAILVEIDDNNTTKTTLIEEYTKREFIRIVTDISNCQSEKEAFNKINKIIHQTRKKQTGQPLVELIIDGTLEFRRSELATDELKLSVIEHLDALVVLVKYYARPKQYAIGANLSIKSNRKQIEFTVIRDMISQYDKYKSNNESVTNSIINLKEMVLNCETNENILNYLKQNLLDTRDTNENT